MAKDLFQIVFDSLDNCLENGYFDPGEQLYQATAREIVLDMKAFDAECEDEPVETLLPLVEMWLLVHVLPA